MYHNPMLELKCGDNSYPLQLAPEHLLSVLSPRPIQRQGTPVELIERALDSCAGSLASFASGDRVVIVTSDVTRPTGSEIYLPLLVSRLNSVGIKDRDIEILIALGIHRKQTPAEHKRIVGELYGRIKVTDHDCDDPGELVYLGDTMRGVPVEVNRRVTEADRVILTGAVTFHYFAGFGGGRKSILPGVSSRKSCMASHFSLLNPEEGGGRHPKAVTGSLDGNPVHEAMLEACGMVAPDFVLNTALGPDKHIIAAFAGEWRDAHLCGCRFYKDTFSAPIDEKGDLVVVSCGGFPKDINLIQAHKSMEYASRALKPGGVMILLAECRDGYGNATFFNWFGHETCAELESALRKRYEINGQTAWSVKEKAERFRIVLVSKLPAEEVRTMGMIPATTLDEALQLALPMLPDRYQAYLIPEGGTVLPVMQT
ncbi:nickel-dependent lactate racemase [Geomonas subterranea]|uniref:Nickel-dependent lactate racemase n=1 Tax=Geomonas subterranea TaxID=2847989 RepID=A0ABX8LIQ7_9BACT|nr:nickel-dependent lactate racemase [Geomonas subterranea]QXE89445.1 nickel-dependent lactate racemase [Geomonas subterranea]QXM08439.1 nickel-dependent lactate racemase [Geomonas subterranea]